MTERPLQLGGLTVPLAVPAPTPHGASLLAASDPFLVRVLPYWQYCLNHYLEAAYVAAMSGQGQGPPPGRRACLEAYPIDPEPHFAGAALKLPLLACYAASGRTGRQSTHKFKNTAVYRLVYALPQGMDFAQEVRIAPMLRAAMDVLLLVTDEGGLDHYQDGARIWQDAGVTRVAFTSWELGYFAKGEGLALRSLALMADLEVEVTQRFNTSTALDLTAQAFTLAAADPDGAPSLELLNLLVTPPE